MASSPTLVQVNSYRGFAFKIDPLDGETIGTAVGQLAAGALVDAKLDIV